MQCKAIISLTILETLKLNEDSIKLFLKHSCRRIPVTGIFISGTLSGTLASQFSNFEMILYYYIGTTR